MAAWVLFAAPAAAAEPPETILSRSTEAGKAGKPWLVIFLFDKSGSMNNQCLEDPIGKGRPNWDVVVEDARRKLEQLPAELGTFDLRIYSFGTDAAAYERPLEGRTFTVGGPDEAKAIAADEIGRMSRPANGQATNLWKSLENLYRGLAATRPGDRYGGVFVEIFSDGTDSLATDGSGRRDSDRRKQKMLEGILVLRDTGTTVKARIVQIGEWKQRPGLKAELGDIEAGELGEAIRPPVKVTYGLAPDRIRIAPMPEAGAGGEFRIRLEGFPVGGPPGKVEIAPAAGSAGIAVDGQTWAGNSGTVRLRATRAMPEGASIPLEVRIGEGGDSRTTLPLTVIVPSFRKVAPVASWGLPPTCEQLAGRPRVMLLRKGSPLEVTLSVPAEAKVDWTVDGAAAGSGPSLRRTDLAAGRNVVTASVSTPDQTLTGEFVAFVLDVAMEIRGPRSVRAGDPLTVEVATPPLPTELADRLGPVEWVVSGAARTETGSSLTATFNRRGSERIEARRSLSVCGTSIDFTASEVIQVRPGPAIRLFGGELVRGQDNRVEAELSAADEISRVLFRIDGTTREGVIERGSGDRPTVAWITVRPGAGSETVIEATPILKDDRGIDRAPTDPECTSRSQSRTFRITDPDVTVAFGSPSEGDQKSFGAPFEIQAAPSGRDLGQVVRVEVELSPASGPPSSITLTADSTWKGSSTPAVAMGGSLRLRAQAFGKDGPLGPPASVTVSLAAARPALASDPADGIVGWDGRNENPKPATVRIVVQGSTVPMARGELSSVEWRSPGDGLRLAGTLDGDAAATFEILRKGVHPVEATVRTADGQTYSLRKDITARPAEVMPAPALPRPEFRSTGAIELDHSATKGAWTDVKLRVRRETGDWEPIVAGTPLDPAPRSDERVAFEAWYRPWGVADSASPWEAGSGWIRGGPVEGIARVPRNWFWPGVAIAVALTLCWLIIGQSRGHPWVRARVWWGAEGYNKRGSIFRDGDGYVGRDPNLKYSFWAKLATIELPDGPPFQSDPGFRWLAKLQSDSEAGRKARIELRADRTHVYVMPDGRHEPGRAAAILDNASYFLKVIHPKAYSGDDGTAEPKPIYLFVNRLDPEHDKHVRLHHYTLFAGGGCLLVACTTLWLILSRTI